ncbi:hypothetical protein VKT23_017338 [Stygiomarasmius scandens]|uniref:Uncharacterized protein n=1 Tax=Marasmiellus scandens TaxID=2682957 RepID=A0ABR1IWF2_9AGAR
MYILTNLCAYYPGADPVSTCSQLRTPYFCLYLHHPPIPPSLLSLFPSPSPSPLYIHTHTKPESVLVDEYWCQCRVLSSTKSSRIVKSSHSRIEIKFLFFLVQVRSLVK